MPSHPFRFLHANHLRLDQSLRGCGSVPAEFREICEDASLIAFDALIETALAQQVDFLLVTGECLNPGRSSLRGAAKLVRGLERLAEQGISTFLAPADLEPDSGWWPDPLPDSVNWLTEFSEALEIEADDQVFATLQWIGPESVGISKRRRAPKKGNKASHSPNAEPDSLPFAIGICRVPSGACRLPSNEPVSSEHDVPVDSGSRTEPALPTGWQQLGLRYLAIESGCERITRQVENAWIHNPGALQGLCASETGPRGCTLVDVDASAHVTTTFLPLAPVRWERQKVSIDSKMNRVALISLLSANVREISAYAQERVRLLAWEFQGSGPLLQALTGADFRAALAEELQRTTGHGDIAAWTHDIRMADSQAVTVPISALASEYARHLAQWKPRRSELLAGCLRTSAIAGSPWEERLHSLLPNLDHDLVLETARHWGISRFAD